MRKKQLLSALLVLCIVFVLLPVPAHAADVNYPVTGGNIYFDLNTGAITHSDKTITEAVIPREIYGVPVTGIGGRAFEQCTRLTSVTIPDSVAAISYKAFEQCTSLTNISIPNSVTSIDSEAFNGCVSLTAVTIPGSLIGIESYTFNGCVKLTDVTILEGTTRIGWYAFNDCVSLASVTIPGSVKSIGQFAFNGCVSLTDVTMLDGMTYIETQAFKNCYNLTRVAIPRSVTSIALGAFTDCVNLSDVYFGGTLQDWASISVSTTSNTPLLGATLHFNSKMPGSSTDPGTPALNIRLSPQTLSVDGNAVACEKYNIDGSNYFKLRDLAQLLNGTGSQFGVGYNEVADTVTITTGAAYTPTGTELTADRDNSATARPSNQSIVVNGMKRTNLTVYNIGGSNFFQLRELGKVLGFEVDYDEATDTAIVRSAQK